MTRFLLLSALAMACAPALEADPAPAWRDEAALAPAAAERPDLRVWAADARLEAAVRAAAGRLAASAGLLVVATPEYDAVPIFWADRDDTEWMGWAHVDAEDGDGTYMAIDEGTPDELVDTVVLHEVLHALGAEHVESGAGVLSPEIWTTFAITEADLSETCAVAPCRAFTPEGSQP
jgi:hypothetical protein